MTYLNSSSSPLLLLPNTYRAFYGSFTQLKSIQKKAINPILEGKDVILQAGTGSGKTEAVLAPCIEKVIRSGRNEAVLYLVPTRALAMDLKRRFEVILTQRLQLNFSIRTGDLKRSGGERPDIMLTTPESLDVMLGSHNSQLRNFASRIRMVIIDEVHPYIHQYRGTHLSYLLKRLEKRVTKLQKIALSATIPDIEKVLHFFQFHPETERVIESTQREIQPSVIHLKNEEQELTALLDHLYKQWEYKKILLFANSRGRCDHLYSIISKKGYFKDVTAVHYSNLNSKGRKVVEDRFRKEDHALCITTSTLELGIDVGDVDAVILFEPPDNVSSFLQRIGRANRRQKKIQFWGICRGEKAGEQTLRFLGLLQLAKKGIVDSLTDRFQPSVLVQQVLSCLYEKKRISLPALQDLFFNDQKTLEDIFYKMQKDRWLRETEVKGISKGGWRYRNLLLEYKIWNNFPETEENFTLILKKEAIADLPRSIVKQLDLGDRVYLAGKRIRILDIEDEKEKKHVFAEPTNQIDEKEIVWLGAGNRVSFEIAQSMKKLLKSANTEDNKDFSGLFSRTRDLINHELKIDQQAAVLENQIEVTLSATGLYRYRTFLGATGNLILEWSIREQPHWNKKEHSISSDEIGVTSSLEIDFQQLQLPLNKEDFIFWTKKNSKILSVLFPLNSFASALPSYLFIEELSGFLFDERLIEYFECYLEKSSKIISGNLIPISIKSENTFTTDILDISLPELSLLDWEKKRWATQEQIFNLPNDYHSRPLTGSMIGEYFRHQQCERWFCSNFLPNSPKIFQYIDDEQLQSHRIEQGKLFERQVLQFLKNQDEITLWELEELSISGERLSLQERFQESIEKIATINSEDIIYLSQGVFLLEQINTIEFPFLISATGIPDLIRMNKKDGKIILEIGDIKHSSSPHYHYQWQISFYSWLLKELVHSQKLPLEVEIANTGFLLLPSVDEEILFTSHSFDISSYLATFPFLLKNLSNSLSQPFHQTTYQLQRHCTTCSRFEFCYQNALKNEDIQFLPQITKGESQILKSLELNTIQQLGLYLEQNKEEDKNRFSVQQKESLKKRVQTFQENQIIFKQRNTRLFPENIDTVILLHVVNDPFSYQPIALGWKVIKYEKTEVQFWKIENDEQKSIIWKSFSSQFLQFWESNSCFDKEPHLVYFGNNTRQTLKSWAESENDKIWLNTAFPEYQWDASHSYWTDLKQVLKKHFYLPISGSINLFSVSYFLQQNVEKDPTSLFHDIQYFTSESEQSDLDLFLNNCLEIITKLWSLAQENLQSDWTRIQRIKTENVLYSAYSHLLTTEQTHKTIDIQKLQQLTLPERVERFRSIGSIQFTGTSLDEEGHFALNFTMRNKEALTKFREGDFLKLVPIGISDLQSGFPVILTSINSTEGTLAIRSRKGKPTLNSSIGYSLEEDSTDWNTPKIIHLVQKIFGEGELHSLTLLLFGQWKEKQRQKNQEWITHWLDHEGQITGLNESQKKALQLPFQHKLSLIEGPPGTGKTHLLGWILIAMFIHAKETHQPLRIAVSALTHQAINGVLQKVVNLLNEHQLRDFPARCIKWGSNNQEEINSEELFQVEYSDHSKDLLNSPYVLVGGTGYGFYRLFDSKNENFPQFFDWVIFDEASQVLVPQALLSLIYGKGNFLFLGDINQLPPIVTAKYGETKSEENGNTSFDIRHSILEHLLQYYDETQKVMLDITYRMNQDICEFPS
ncbi:MAG: putative RecB family nuclease, partial [bacterium]